MLVPKPVFAGAAKAEKSIHSWGTQGRSAQVGVMTDRISALCGFEPLHAEGYQLFQSNTGISLGGGVSCIGRKQPPRLLCRGRVDKEKGGRTSGVQNRPWVRLGTTMGRAVWLVLDGVEDVSAASALQPARVCYRVG